MDVELREKPLVVLVDQKAGNWPANSFLLFSQIANECLENKLSSRPEMTEVCMKRKPDTLGVSEPMLTCFYRYTRNLMTWCPRVL